MLTVVVVKTFNADCSTTVFKILSNEQTINCVLRDVISNLINNYTDYYCGVICVF